MSNNNIYDIAISELIARDDLGGNSSGTATESIRVTLDSASLIALNTSVPNPIVATSSVTNILSGWQIDPSSHKIFFTTFTGSYLQLSAGSNDILIGNDTNNGTTSGSAGQDVRKYYSEIILEEIAAPGTFRTITSEIITITSVISIYYGFNATIPADITDLNNSILQGVSVLSIGSNNVYEDFYITLPDTESQPVAIADEHGLITEISEYPIQVGAIANFTTYKYKWPIKFTGSYLHTFTLIYS